MRKDKNKAISLRKNGKSYTEIRAELGVSVATLSDWFHGQDWSHTLSKRLNDKYLASNKARIVRLDKIRGENLSRLYQEARDEARQEFQLLKNHPLFVVGVAIYWGEGDKVSTSGFRISNSDPSMIRVFRKFLVDVCNVDQKRIRASLLIYPDLIEEECKEFWIQNGGLQANNFTKSTTIIGKHKKRKVQHGVCSLVFSSRFLKEKMLVWIRLMAEELSRN